MADPPSDLEVAAVVAALALVTAHHTPERPETASAWADRAAAVHAPPRPGPDAWRRSLGWRG